MSEDHEREYARIRANIDVLSRDVLSVSQMIMDWLKAAIKSGEYQSPARSEYKQVCLDCYGARSATLAESLEALGQQFAELVRLHYIIGHPLLSDESEPKSESEPKPKKGKS